MEKYAPGNADRYSLFVVGDARSHFVGSLGNASTTVSNEIQLLKTYILVRKIGDVPISNEVILQAMRSRTAI